MFVNQVVVEAIVCFTCRRLLRRFPDFPDMRAALTAALWDQGSQGEAETQWGRVDDPRYHPVSASPFPPLSASLREFVCACVRNFVCVYLFLRV